MKFESFLFESEIDIVKKELESTDQYLKAPNGKKTNLTARQWLIVRTKSFKKWFGDWEHDPKSASKVLDENNEPLVAYHGTNATFTKFEIDKTGSYGHDFGKLIFFTDNSAVASAYSIRFNKNKEYLDKKEMIDNLMSKLSNVVKKYGIPSPEFDAVRKEWETTGHALQDEQNAIYNAIERFELITDNATVYAGFINIKKPLFKDGKGQSWLHVHEDAFNEYHEHGGYDGVIIKSVKDGATTGSQIPSTIYAFPKPNQIKSAIGNKGTFDKDSDHIHESI